MTAWLAERVPGVFATLIDGGVLRVAETYYNERSFGNEAVWLHAGDWYVVIGKDRDCLEACPFFVHAGW